MSGLTIFIYIVVILVIIESVLGIMCLVDVKNENNYWWCQHISKDFQLSPILISIIITSIMVVILIFMSLSASSKSSNNYNVTSGGRRRR